MVAFITTPNYNYVIKCCKQKEFYDIKRVVGWDTLLSYPDFHKLFDIHMDDSNHRLCAVIIQDRKTIASYSRRLTEMKMWYTGTEK